MAQVLLFHAWTIGSLIGVDAFILVSAFLMTSSFIRRSEAGHMPFFIERWGNTFKRLLPPLVVVVLATLAATFYFLPATRWKETTIQAFASITYWENWRLVEVAADYYANDHGLSSPLQHLWSMSMQGQIFLLWPLLMTLCVLFARKRGIGIRQVVIVAFGILTVASLAWLIFWAPQDGSIYFDTRARIWEFAFGSMVAAAAPWLKLGKQAAAIVSTVALAVLLLFCLVSIGSYPGPMAIFPMASTSVLMLYGPTIRGFGVERFLSWKPLTALGDISYAVYLIHWPIFVIYLAYNGKDSFTLVEGSALIIVSVVLAWLLTTLVDNPLRHLPWANSSTPHKYVVVFVSLLVGLVPVGFVYLWIDSHRSHVDDQFFGAGQGLTSNEYYTAIPGSGPGSNEYPGARVLLGGAEDLTYSESPIPGPLEDNLFMRWADQCPDDFKDSFAEAKQGFCTAHGDLESSRARVLVAGSSHAQMLLVAPIVPLLDANDWSALGHFRGGCPWTMPGAQIPAHGQETIDDCTTINQALLDQVDIYKPDYAFLVVTTTRPTAESDIESLVPEVKELI